MALTIIDQWHSRWVAAPPYRDVGAIAPLRRAA
jgi:hypothetical protein